MKVREEVIMTITNFITYIKKDQDSVWEIILDKASVIEKKLSSYKESQNSPNTKDACLAENK